MAASMQAAGENEATLQVKASELPCCKLIAAPVPDVRAGIGKTKVAPVTVSSENVRQAITEITIEHKATQTELEPFASPPDRQPLLCTFLI